MKHPARRLADQKLVTRLARVVKLMLQWAWMSGVSATGGTGGAGAGGNCTTAGSDANITWIATGTRFGTIG